MVLSAARDDGDHAATPSNVAKAAARIRWYFIFPPGVLLSACVTPLIPCSSLTPRGETVSICRGDELRRTFDHRIPVIHLAVYGCHQDVLHADGLVSGES